MNNVVVIAPPFYSHFHPMLVLAKCFRAEGSEVTVACAQSFKPRITEAGLRFVELEITRNANTGVAAQTDQPDEEAERLNAFLEATRKGAIETLLVQSRHRQLDMLADPDRIREEIRAVSENLQPDLFVVDQLSYPVSLALYCLRKPFVTFCPGHPTYIPENDQLFGVPYAWPREFSFHKRKLDGLIRAAQKVRSVFTSLFNQIMQDYDEQLTPISDAFKVTSDRAVLFNYPDFGNLHKNRSEPKKVFMGYCFEEEVMDSEWQAVLEKRRDSCPKVLISLGTFLSARDDVLRKLTEGIRKHFPRSLCVVSAGSSYPALKDMEGEQVIVREFLPQKGLLKYMDLFIHHGGNNSFTESLYFAVPMVILPFSSDQFSIARDAQNAGIAECMNPNVFDEMELKQKMDRLLSTDGTGAVKHWSAAVRSRGPCRGVQEVCRID